MTATGGIMNAWILHNVPVLEWLVGALIVITVVLSAFWICSIRNTHVLSRELNAADREISAGTNAAVEQGARLRIIRELFDGVVLSVSQIVRQADAAGYLLDAAPGAAERSAKLVAALARETLAELRRIFTIAGDGQSAVQAQPRLQRLATLLDERRRAGLTITFSESGNSFEPQPGANAAINRIVEEALSNALKFGGPGTVVHVSFVWTEEGLQVLIDDNGVQSRAQPPGLSATTGPVAQQRSYIFEEVPSTLLSAVE